MSEASPLREQAAKARRLALSLSSGESQKLIDYADECEAEAARQESGSTDHQARQRPSEP